MNTTIDAIEHTLDEHGRTLEQHDGRLNVLEKTDAVHDARLDSLTTFMRWIVAAIFGLLLITILIIAYGALGERGFNAVTNAVPKLAPAQEVR